MKLNTKCFTIVCLIALLFTNKFFIISYADSSTEVPIYRTDTKTVTTSKTSSNNSFPDTIDYTDTDGYKGTYYKNGSSWVISGTGPDSKSVTQQKSSANNDLASTIDYDDGTYKGTLTGQGSWSDTVQTGGTAADSKSVSGYWDSNGNFQYDSYTPPEDKWTLSSWYPSHTSIANGGHTVYYGSLDRYNKYLWDIGGAWQRNTDYEYQFPNQPWYPLDKQYNDGTYSGSLHRYSTTSIDEHDWNLSDDGGLHITQQYSTTWYYKGTVSKPDTRTYKTTWYQNYTGTVNRPDTRTWQQNYSGTVSRTVIDSYLDAELTNDLPDVVLVNQNFTFHITAKNIGTHAWSEGEQIRLGAVDNSDPFANSRYTLPCTVYPQQSYTFTINAKAPSITGDYLSDWQMLQEGYSWFGNVTSKTVKVIDIGLSGTVGHTNTWNDKRLKYNSLHPISQRAENVFWPGEDFILNANTAYTASSVSVNIEGTSFSTNLVQTSTNTWTGDLWDKSMVYWPNKNLNFIFTANFIINGITYTRTYIVPVIIDSSSGLWMQHREF